MFKINTIQTYQIPDKKPIKLDSPNILGSGNRKILILLQINKEEVILPQEFDLLNKILMALKLNAEDVWIANINQWSGNTIGQWKNALPFEKLILFGVDDKHLFNQISFPQFYVLPFMDFKLLTAPSLSFMLDEKNKKAKTDLWNALKNWFAI